MRAALASFYAGEPVSERHILDIKGLRLLNSKDEAVFGEGDHAFWFHHLIFFRGDLNLKLDMDTPINHMSAYNNMAERLEQELVKKYSNDAAPAPTQN